MKISLFSFSKDLRFSLSLWPQKKSQQPQPLLFCWFLLSLFLGRTKIVFGQNLGCEYFPRLLKITKVFRDLLCHTDNIQLSLDILTSYSVRIQLV